MSIDIEERFGSRKKVGNQYEFLYQTTGSDDEAEVETTVLDEAPGSYLGYARGEIISIEAQGNGLFFATVVYPTDGAIAGSESEAAQSFEFDTSTGTQHVTNALNSNRTVYSEGTNEYPNFGNAVNVEGVGDNLNVLGTDIGVKVFDFSVTRKVSIEDIDAAYLTSLYTLSWTYNKNAAITVTMLPGIEVTFPAGTLLFKGARGGGQEGDKVSITYLLSFSPNLTNFDVDDITVTSKLGWQYCWAYRVPQVVSDSSGKSWLVPKAVAVYVDDMYFAGDLTQLNID